jgi:hypothetical protein
MYLYIKKKEKVLPSLISFAYENIIIFGIHFINDVCKHILIKVI